VYVLYRMADFPDASPWAALDADSVHFQRVYATPTHRVYLRRS